MTCQPLNERSTRRERGSVLVVALVVLSALLMVGTIVIIKVERGSRASAEARFQSVALFAAESGVSSAMQFLRTNVDPSTFFTAFVSPNNSVVQSPAGIFGNSRPHLDPNNLFSGETKMSYEVSLLNNVDDSGFAAGDDNDGVLVMRSIGRGPGTSMVVLDVQIDGSVAGPLKILSWRAVQ